MKAHGETLWRTSHGGSCPTLVVPFHGDVDMLMTSPSVPSMNKDDYIERIQFLHRLRIPQVDWGAGRDHEYDTNSQVCIA